MGARPPELRRGIWLAYKELAAFQSRRLNAPSIPATSDEAVSAASTDVDDVLISSEAQAAAKLASLVALAKQNDIRQEKVEQAKQALAQGAHKKPEVVSELAERISKFL